MDFDQYSTTTLVYRIPFRSLLINMGKSCDSQGGKVTGIHEIDEECLLEWYNGRRWGNQETVLNTSILKRGSGVILQRL